MSARDPLPEGIARDPEALMAEADRAQREQRWPEEEVLRAAVVECLDARAGEVDEALALALRAQAGNLRRQGKYAEAEPVLARVVEVVEAIDGPDHASLGLVLDQLAAAISRAHPERTKDVKRLEVRAARIRARRR